ncbi:MAG: hypothetical protein IJI07_08630 [Flexilinea sp.]|nr:hypothetical protein [Flexilinea sp.]
MKKKKIIPILLILVLTGISLRLINRDLFHYTYDLRLERTFTPDAANHQDYLLTAQIPLKPGSYVLSPMIIAEGSGSGIFLSDADDQEIFYAELTDGAEDPSFPFAIEGQTKQIRFGVRYDPEHSVITVKRLRITSGHVLYRDSLLRHLTLSALLVLAAVLIMLRLCFPQVFWKIFPLFASHENELAFWILTGLTLTACYPLFNVQTYVRGEDMFFHLTRIKGLAESLRAGYFPVRDQLYWLRNYGYGVGFYYPDVFLYFPAVMVLLGFDLLTAYKLFLGLCSFFSILSVWYTAFRMTKNRTTAYAAAVFMAYAAYRLSNLYYRGTVGETQAAVFFPLIILGLYEIFYGEIKKWPAFAFGFLGLLCCHVISLTMAAALTVLFLLTQLRKIFTDRRIITALLGSAVLVIGIGAFFWMPMLEQSLTNPELRVNSVLAGEAAFNRTNYAFPVQNLLSRFKRWNFAFQADCIYPGWSLLIVPLLGAAVGKKRDRTVKAADFMLIFSAVLIWMCTRAFPWTWKIFLPFVTRIQFAYRLLLPATVLLCLSGAVYFTAVIRDRKPFFMLGILALFCFFSTAYPILQETVLNRTVDKNLFVMQDNRVSGAEYLPQGLDSDFPDKNADTVFIPENDPGLKITAHDRQRLSFRFSYELPEGSPEVKISVPLIYYTGFRGTLTAEDGTVIRPEIGWDARGLVSLSNSGISKGTVFVSYQKTAVQRAGEAITLLTVILCAALFLHRNRRRQDKKLSARV